MKKRLAQLCDVVENDENVVILAVKEGTKPFDLIRLGFTGTETMFRMTKERENTSVTIFKEDEKPFSMSMGSRGTTVVSEGMRIARNLIVEAVHLDFGIVTHGAYANRFREAVAATVGTRDLDSHRYFELQRASAYCSLWVNQGHIANIPHAELDDWLAARNIKLNIEHTRTSGCCPVDVGTMERADRILERAKVNQLLMVIENNKGLAEHNFLATESWLHGHGFSEESTAYANQGMEGFSDWQGFYLGPNVTYDVKRCDSLEELQLFMDGEFNDTDQASKYGDWYWDFQLDNCTPQALGILSEMQLDGEKPFEHGSLCDLMQKARARATNRSVDHPIDPAINKVRKVER